VINITWHSKRPCENCRAKANLGQNEGDSMSEKRQLKRAAEAAIKARADYNRMVEKVIAETKIKNPKISPDEIYLEYSQEFFILDDKVKSALSKYWIYRADELLVPEPDSKDLTMWETPMFGNRILTEKGVHELRKMVRTEIKDRHSVILPWIAAAFTLAVTLTGLANLFWNIAKP
jgi:hypothetical protein